MPNFFEEHTDSLACRAAAGLSRLSLALRSRAWVDAGERSLTPTQGQILALLRSRGGPALRLTQVAELLSISAPTASDSVRALVKKGLVQKTRSMGDARAVALELTSNGALEAERVDAWPEFLRSAIMILPEDEQEAFLVSVMKIIGELIERGQIPIQRMCVMCRFFRPNVHADRAPPHHCALVDAPLGNRHLRLDCNEHEPADGPVSRRNLAVFAAE